MKHVVARLNVMVTLTYCQYISAVYLRANAYSGCDRLSIIQPLFHGFDALEYAITSLVKVAMIVRTNNGMISFQDHPNG